ncbi:MAG: hypothetical protein ACRENN_04655 [Candidatus Eiseniibacteriota bacterium]
MNDPSQLDRDLEALRELSTREIPDLDVTLQAIRRREAQSHAERWNFRRKVMALVHSIRTRPAVAVGTVAVLAVLVALVLPVSYDKVTGQDVALTVSGNGIGEAEVAGVAHGFKGALHAGSVMVEAGAEDAGTSYVLHTTMPKRLTTEMRQATAAFASDLAAKGFAASVQVTPHRERVRYPAVAYAFDQIIQISVDGKSSVALEQEIRARLAQAGVANAQVSVTDRPEGGQEVRLNMQQEQQGVVPGTPPPSVPQVVLTKNGAPITGGQSMTVKVQKQKINDAVTLIVDVAQNGKNATVTVPNSQSMSDPALAAEITAQLQRAGIMAKVTVVGGKISVEETR